MLYITSLGLIYFITGILYLLTPFWQMDKVGDSIPARENSMQNYESILYVPPLNIRETDIIQELHIVFLGRVWERNNVAGKARCRHATGNSEQASDTLKCLGGTSLVVQWLRLWASTAGGTGSILGQRTKIPHAARCGQKKKKSALENHKEDVD